MLTREIADYLKYRLVSRRRILENSEEYTSLSPDNTGELQAIVYIERELNVRLRFQDKNTIDKDWEQSFITLLKNDTLERETPKQRAATKYVRAYGIYLETLVAGGTKTWDECIEEAENMPMFVS